jgi:uncharacterized membrane protein
MNRPESAFKAMPKSRSEARIGSRHESRLDQVFGWLIWSISVLCVAGLTHIIIILALPHLLAERSYAQLSKMAKAQELTMLESLPVPFADPMLAQGLCLYDLSKGILRIHAATVPGRFLSFSFHAKTGQIFYALTDRAAQNGNIDVVVSTENQLDSLANDDDENTAVKDLRLVAPHEQGFILIKALRTFPTEAPEAAALVQSVGCSVETIKDH